MEISVSVPDTINPVVVFGVHDSNIRLLEKIINVKIYFSKDKLILAGEEANILSARSVIKNMFKMAQNNIPISHTEIKLMAENSYDIEELNDDFIFKDGLTVSLSGNKLKPKNKHQLKYMKMILKHDLVFGIGPAGTGKTFIAVAVGLHLLFKQQVHKLILTRPVVEAGENLGFLPGTLEEKIDPYLRPLFDAMLFMMKAEELKKLMETQIIELAPLAYMRGRTLSNAFIILDEAQNTTRTQMKMFLTRLGENSRMVVTGDITQIDLKSHDSGLSEAINLFANTEEIGIMRFENRDVIRHGLVKKIIELYEKRE